MTKLSRIASMYMKLHFKKTLSQSTKIERSLYKKVYIDGFKQAQAMAIEDMYADGYLLHIMPEIERILRRLGD